MTLRCKLQKLLSMLLVCSIIFTSTACASSPPALTLSDPNEQVITENIEVETILTENRLSAFITEEIYLEEIILAEDRITELLLEEDTIYQSGVFDTGGYESRDEKSPRNKDSRGVCNLGSPCFIDMCAVVSTRYSQNHKTMNDSWTYRAT